MKLLLVFLLSFVSILHAIGGESNNDAATKVDTRASWRLLNPTNGNLPAIVDEFMFEVTWRKRKLQDMFLQVVDLSGGREFTASIPDAEITYLGEFLTRIKGNIPESLKTPGGYQFVLRTPAKIYSMSPIFQIAPQPQPQPYGAPIPGDSVIPSQFELENAVEWYVSKSIQNPQFGAEFDFSFRWNGPELATSEEILTLHLVDDASFGAIYSLLISNEIQEHRNGIKQFAGKFPDNVPEMAMEFRFALKSQYRTLAITKAKINFRENLQIVQYNGPEILQENLENPSFLIEKFGDIYLDDENNLKPSIGTGDTKNSILLAAVELLDDLKARLKSHMSINDHEQQQQDSNIANDLINLGQEDPNENTEQNQVEDEDPLKGLEVVPHGQNAFYNPSVASSDQLPYQQHGYGYQPQMTGYPPQYTGDGNGHSLVPYRYGMGQFGRVLHHALPPQPSTTGEKKADRLESDPLNELDPLKIKDGEKEGQPGPSMKEMAQNNRK